VDLFRQFLFRIRAIFHRRSRESEMDEEIRGHLEMERTSIRPEKGGEEAYFEAQRHFGGVDQVKEMCRDEQNLVWVVQPLQDVRYAVRQFARAPGYSCMVVMIFGLGIAVSTALFSVIYAWLLDPYPYAKTSEIWAPSITNPKNGQDLGFQEGDFLAMAQLPGVEATMATSFNSVLLRGDLTPEVVNAPRVSASAFAFLGVQPILGRGLAPSDVKPNGTAESIVVLSFQIWQRLYNGDNGVVGRTIILDDQVYTIVGVMPPRFGWYTNDGLWLPMPLTDLTLRVRPILRLRPGVLPIVAEQQLKSLFLRVAKESPSRYPKDQWSVALLNYLDVSSVSDELRSSLRLLRYAVACLLMIACTNVANLMLARGTARSREIAIRLAIGAGRTRIIRQLLTEGVLMALFGGAVGLLIAFGFTRMIVGLMPPDYLPNESRVTMNLWVLGFTFLVSLVTGILAALAPALQCTKPDLNSALKSGGQNATAGARPVVLRNFLVVVEVALSVVLLVGAGLTIRGFAELSRLNPGYDPSNLLVVRTSLQANRYATLNQRSGFVRDVLERFQGMPGVLSVCVGAPPHFEGDSPYAIAGQGDQTQGRVSVNFVSSDYLSTYRIPLLSGRNLTPNEVVNGARVALITQAAAKLWPSATNPLGRTIELDRLGAPSAKSDLSPDHASKAVTIVGVVEDVRNYSTIDARSPSPPAVFVPYSLRGKIRPTFILRTQGNPRAILGLVRATIRNLDKDIPLAPVWSVEEILGQQVIQPRFNASLFSGLGGAALALAAAGIYGVLSYNVSQRSREIGLRIALGARSFEIQRLILGNGFKLMGIGLLTGLGISEALLQFAKSRVFIVPLNDPTVFAFVAILLSLVALVACLMPARRAACVDPNLVLKNE
jgi:predicted permease